MAPPMRKGSPKDFDKRSDSPPLLLGGEQGSGGRWPRLSHGGGFVFIVIMVFESNCFFFLEVECSALAVFLGATRTLFRGFHQSVGKTVPSEEFWHAR